MLYRGKEVIDISSDGLDDSFVVDERELERLDGFIMDVYAGKAGPIAGPSNATRQTTLFGTILPNSPRKEHVKTTIQRSKSNSKNPFGGKPRKTKVWDHTAFAKSGQRKDMERTHGKKRALPESEGEGQDDDEVLDFEQFPAPFVSSKFKASIFERLLSYFSASWVCSPLFLQSYPYAYICRVLTC